MLEFYLDSSSPWTYLALSRLPRVEAALTRPSE